MGQITARLPDAVVDALDEAASRLKRSRAELVRSQTFTRSHSLQNTASSTKSRRNSTPRPGAWGTGRQPPGSTTGGS